MSRFGRGLFGHLVLVLALLGLSMSGTPAAAQNAAGMDVIALAKLIEDGKPTANAVAAIKKKYDDLEMVMENYKPQKRKGLGYDAEFNKLAKEGIGAGALGNRKAALLKMGYFNLAIGQLAPHYF